MYICMYYIYMYIYVYVEERIDIFVIVYHCVSVLTGRLFNSVYMPKDCCCMKLELVYNN